MGPRQREPFVLGLVFRRAAPPTDRRVSDRNTRSASLPFMSTNLPT
jgi:hypothetical protein